MIEFKNISKVYPGNKVAVDNVNIQIEEGSFVCFIGTSGSGKTTCMRMINRMVNPTKGTITINGKDIKETNEVSLRREIGYVIQQIGLMPHMTIYENIVTVPKLLKWEEAEMRSKAESLMERIDLDPSYLDAYPKELSGGMQQRIGVIRALAADQKIILMDEPFGALDPITRDTLQRLIKRLQKEMKKTVVFVTHDMDEALNLADHIVIMDHGRIVQQGSPKDILTHPENDFVAELIGEKRLSQARFEYETVESIMIHNPITILESATMREAADLMAKTRVDDILVVDDQGILKGRLNIHTLTQKNHPNTLVKTIMKQVTFILDSTSIRDAIYYIDELGNRNISVVDVSGKLKGLVTRSAIVTTIYDVLWREYEPEENGSEELASQIAAQTDEKVVAAQGSKEGENA